MTAEVIPFRLSEDDGPHLSGGARCCGNDLFVVTRSGILCAHCGLRQTFEDCFPHG